MPKIIVQSNNIRLDQYLADTCHITRSQINKTIKAGIILNGILVNKPSLVVKVNDLIELDLPNTEIDVVASNDSLKILYEDEYILIIDKIQGMVVHQSTSSKNPNTVVNALLNYTNKLSTIDPIRMGIVHRLDKDTSGVLIIARTDEVHEKLQQAFKDRKVTRKYLGICCGVLKEKTGTISAPIGRSTSDRKKMTVSIDGKEAVTKYKVLEEFNKYSLLEFELVTGRTHQIRVHMRHIGHPVAGDSRYCGDCKLHKFGQLLHSYYVKFIHPITAKEVEITCEAPAYFQNILAKLKDQKK